MKTKEARIQSRRRLGDLWQVLYGLSGGRQVYGYGATLGKAAEQARQRFAPSRHNNPQPGDTKE